MNKYLNPKKYLKFIKRKIKNKSFKKLDKIDVVIAGWPGSGSTFLYQASKKLGLKTKKIHGRYRNKDKGLVLFTFRDPRDSICSNAKRSSEKIWKENGAEKAILFELDNFIKGKYKEALYKSVDEKNTILVRYENYFLKNEKALIYLISDQFLILLNKYRLESILEDISIKKNIARSKKFNSFKNYDKETQIHGNHISNQGLSGAWKKYFTEKIEKEFKEKLGDLIINLGYEENSDWSFKK